MRLEIHKDRCVGCQACALICSAHHNKTFNPKRSRIRTRFQRPIPGTPVFCLQCKQPDCATACPTGALYWDEKRNFVAFNESTCTACELCILACPFDGIFYNPEFNEILKCDLCDGDPMCIKICQKSALTLQD